MTNSSGTRHTIDNLQPYTVYTFSVTAVNTVGRSAASKQSYPAVTLMESEYYSGRKEGNAAAANNNCEWPIVPFGAQSTGLSLGLNCLPSSHKGDGGSSSSLLSHPILLSRACPLTPAATLISCVSPSPHRIPYSKLSLIDLGQISQGLHGQGGHQTEDPVF